MTMSRIALLQLGKRVAADLGSGGMSPVMRSLGAALSETPDAAATVLALLLAETRKKRSSDALIAAFAFMIGEALRTVRIRIENGDAAAGAVIDGLKTALSTAALKGKVPPEALLLVAQQFAAARLDLGDELRDVMLDCMEETSGDDQQVGPDQLAAHFTEMAEALDHDPFLIHANLSETLSALPEEHRIGIIGAIAMSDAPSIRDAAIGWLLDESALVGGNTAFVLTEVAAHGLVSARSINRMVTLRNWVPEERRGAVDAAIRIGRKQGQVGEPALGFAVEGVIGSLCDGSGAQSFFVVLKRGRRFALASLLVKHGDGVRDAWVRADMSKTEVRAVLAEIALEMDTFATSLDVIRSCLANGLAEGLGRGAMPPFGLLQFLEATGISDVKPEPLSVHQLVEGLLDDLSDDRKTGAATARALKASRDWPDRYLTLDSWFEVGQDIEAVMVQKATGKARAETIIEGVLPRRRESWAGRLAWTALVARDAEEDEDWIDFALVARELLGDRHLRQIPMAAWIARNSVEAVGGNTGSR